jgi:hypothetical protein
VVNRRSFMVFWDSTAPATQAQVEWIDYFDARGMRRVYGRGDHFGRNHIFNMDIWKTRDGRLLMRCWSQCDDIDGRSFQITGVDLSAIPARDKEHGFQESCGTSGDIRVGHQADISDIRVRL